jgi:hypothetical protein
MAPQLAHRIALAALGVLGRIHIFAFILMILGAITQMPSGAGPHRLIFWIYGFVWMAVFAIEWLIIRVVRARRGVDLEAVEPTDVQIDAAPEISATRLLIPSLFMLFVGVMLGRLEDIQVLVPSWIGVKVAEAYLRPRRMIIKVRRAASVGRLEMARSPLDPPHITVIWLRPGVLKEFEEAVAQQDAASAARVLIFPGALTPRQAAEAASAFIRRAHPTPPPVMG